MPRFCQIRCQELFININTTSKNVFEPSCPWYMRLTNGQLRNRVHSICICAWTLLQPSARNTVYWAGDGALSHYLEWMDEPVKNPRPTEQPRFFFLCVLRRALQGCKQAHVISWVNSFATSLLQVLIAKWFLFIVCFLNYRAHLTW
jgi:hypothetical protein